MERSLATWRADRPPPHCPQLPAPAGPRNAPSNMRPAGCTRSLTWHLLTACRLVSSMACLLSAGVGWRAPACPSLAPRPPGPPSAITGGAALTGCGPRTHGVTGTCCSPLAPPVLCSLCQSSPRLVKACSCTPVLCLVVPPWSLPCLLLYSPVAATDQHSQH